MEKWAIVTDSSSNLLEKDGAALGTVPLYIVPLRLQFGDKEFVDDERLVIPNMVAYAEKSRGRSSTAAPSPQAWKECFMRAENVLAFSITGALSGSYSSACVGREMALEENPALHIQVFDSRSTGPELVLLVRKAQELISAGESFTTAVLRLERYARLTHLLFVLQSMDNLKKNGRVHPLIANAVGALGIQLIGCASQKGTLQLVKKARGGPRMWELLLEEMERNGYQGSRVVISHCLNEAGAEKLRSLLLSRYPNGDISVMENRGLCSYYAERGGLLIGYEG